jgi:hypothetical protein
LILSLLLFNIVFLSLTFSISPFPSQAVDKQTGYRTKSVLCMPIRGAAADNGRGQRSIIGVLQVRLRCVSFVCLFVYLAFRFVCLSFRFFLCFFVYLFATVFDCGQRSIIGVLQVRLLCERVRVCLTLRPCESVHRCDV